MAIRFVIVGGGPAGNTAATYGARLGAEVTLIERDILGGAAHLWDCIPSKAMIATGSALSYVRHSDDMGLDSGESVVDIAALRQRVQSIEARLARSITELLQSQNVRLIRGRGTLKGPHEIVAETADGLVELSADIVVLATGSRPRIPEWAVPDGDRILTTRDSY